MAFMLQQAHAGLTVLSVQATQSILSTSALLRLKCSLLPQRPTIAVRPLAHRSMHSGVRRARRLMEPTTSAPSAASASSGPASSSSSSSSSSSGADRPYKRTYTPFAWPVTATLSVSAPAAPEVPHRMSTRSMSAAATTIGMNLASMSAPASMYSPSPASSSSSSSAESLFPGLLTSLPAPASAASATRSVSPPASPTLSPMSPMSLPPPLSKPEPIGLPLPLPTLITIPSLPSYPTYPTYSPSASPSPFAFDDLPSLSSLYTLKEEPVSPRSMASPSALRSPMLSPMMSPAAAPQPLALPSLSDASVVSSGSEAPALAFLDMRDLPLQLPMSPYADSIASDDNYSTGGSVKLEEKEEEAADLDEIIEEVESEVDPAMSVAAVLVRMQEAGYEMDSLPTQIQIALLR